MEREAAVLSIISSLFAPFVPSFVGRARRAFYFSYLPGVNGADVFARASSAERMNIAEAFGSVLRQVHTWVPPIPYPENDWLEQAIAQCIVNTVHHNDLLRHTFNPFNGQDTQEIVNQLQGWRKHEQTDLVFNHGDWCLPNVLLQQGSITGVIDWSNGGWKDRRYDLATGLWTLRRNAGSDPALPDYHNAFLRSYGFSGSVSDLAYFEAMYALL